MVLIRAARVRCVRSTNQASELSGLAVNRNSSELAGCARLRSTQGNPGVEGAARADFTTLLASTVRCASLSLPVCS
jgi:hypothetical protein